MHLVKTWAMPGVLGLVGTYLLATEEDSPALFAGAPHWLNQLRWALGLATVAITFLVALRRAISESDNRTKTVVTAAHQETAAALAKQFEQFRREQSAKDKAQEPIAPQLYALRKQMVDMGDLSEQVHASAFEIGELRNRQEKAEKDLNALHAWKREMMPWRQQMDEWRKEHEQRRIQSEAVLTELVDKWRKKFEEDREKTNPGRGLSD